MDKDIQIREDTFTIEKVFFSNNVYLIKEIRENNKTLYINE